MITNRYRDTFKLVAPEQNVGQFKISDRETDVYVQFNGGDRLDVMSNRIYGVPDYWWVILSANDYSIEFDIEPGEILRVPFPISDVLSEIRGQF